MHLSEVLVLPSLSSMATVERIKSIWPHLRNLQLANPHFARCVPIDLLIGADLYGTLLRNSNVHGPTGTPSTHLTTLGWVVIGRSKPIEENSDSISIYHTLTLSKLGKQVERF